MYFKSPGIFKRWVWQSNISCPTNQLTSRVHCWWYKSICRNRDIAVWCCRTIEIASNLQLDTRLMHKRIKGISKHFCIKSNIMYSLQVPVFLLATMLLLEEVWHPLFDSEHPLLSQLRLDLFCSVLLLTWVRLKIKIEMFHSGLWQSHTTPNTFFSNKFIIVYLNQKFWHIFTLHFCLRNIRQNITMTTIL